MSYMMKFYRTSPVFRTTAALFSCFFIVAVMVVMFLIVAVIVHLESSGGMRWNIFQKRPEE